MPMIRCLVVALVVTAPLPAAAQQTIPSRRVTSDIVAGYAGFLDESLIDHGVVAATIRYQVTRRLSIGPEVVYMNGPGRDRDLFVTGNAMFDFLQRRAGSRSPSVNPYLVAGGGLMHHQSQFGDFSSAEGAWTAGAGVRVWVTERAYALGEYRIGWEPHVRITGGLGVLW
jgi:hypothetical protein